jgi:hypothetical protein
MNNSVAEHQFRAYLSVMPSCDALAGLILLACRKQDKELLTRSWCYFSKEFGISYFSETYHGEIEPLLTIEEQQWIWALTGCDD